MPFILIWAALLPLVVFVVSTRYSDGAAAIAILVGGGAAVVVVGVIIVEG